MLFKQKKHSKISRAIAIALVCLFAFNSIAWSLPEHTIAAQSRLKPFFEKHGLRFQNIATVTYAAGELRNLVASDRLRPGEIVRINGKLQNPNLEIVPDIRQSVIKCTGKDYSYVVFQFKEENKALNALLIKDHKKLTPEELEELGIDEDEVHHLDRPGLEGVWFVSPYPIKTRQPDKPQSGETPEASRKVAEVQKGKTLIDTVLEGGGAKGVAYVGALDVVAERNMWFRKVAGTSAGAITAALIAAGYNHEEIKTIVFETDFNKFKDKRWGFVPPWMNLLFFGGLYRGRAFEKWMAKKLEDKLGYEPTLKDLPIPLTVIASDLSDAEMLILNAQTAPDLEVSKAVRMSMGIPFFFNVFHWLGEYQDKIKTRHVVDGGLLSNFPIFVLEKDGEEGVPVVGFMLHEIKQKKKKKPFWSRIAGLIEKAPLVHILLRVLETGLDAHDKRHIEDATWARIVDIPVDVGTTDFNLTTAQKEELAERGRKATEKVLDKVLAEAERIRMTRVHPAKPAKEDVATELRPDRKDEALPEKPLTPAEAEAERIHRENLKVEYVPLIPDKTIICHIVTDSILPMKQRSILKTLEQKMRDANKYSERVVSLSVGDRTDPEAFMSELEKVKAREEARYEKEGYAIQFDVACPSKELVGKVQDKYNMQALAFAKESEGDTVQVEGIILALRVLRAGKIEDLRRVYRLLTGRDPNMSTNDIKELAKSILFVLPVTRLNVDEIRRLNTLIEENIANAA
ncbi:patatin-like phospholipase family protein [Candidatus Omnitrophota bacterium]